MSERKFWPSSLANILYIAQIIQQVSNFLLGEGKKAQFFIEIQSNEVPESVQVGEVDDGGHDGLPHGPLAVLHQRDQPLEAAPVLAPNLC